MRTTTQVWQGFTHSKPLFRPTATLATSPTFFRILCLPSALSSVEFIYIDPTYFQSRLNHQ
eukprot:m.39797 g.39797  ORF g.39797 m.39797 type:complete len:61 (-) comp14753_c0_seq3:318-500(-)